MKDKERTAIRMAMLHEVTGLMGDVLKKLEQREGTRPKHVVNMAIRIGWWFLRSSVKYELRSGWW